MSARRTRKIWEYSRCIYEFIGIFGFNSSTTRNGRKAAPDLAPLSFPTMRSLQIAFLAIVLILVLLPSVNAFGAGSIPDYGFLKGKAYRHGDLENTLERLVRNHAASGGGLLQTLVGGSAGGKKFSTRDIRHVYFGNWLRDYSQAMDIAGLQKLSKETLIMIVSVLSFMTFGFATEEFEVTAQRLGVYLPVEHIDNPKGYAEKEGDPRQFHPWLRPPVHPAELEIDLRTGMKNYIANEGNFWDTSTACVRRNLGRCIELARSCQLEHGPALYEAYRLLGTGLHTLEDLLAHSNWVELMLIKMGYNNVFPYVGENVRIQTPNGYAPPLVTGTFGGADFMFSVMSEGGDKISQNCLEDLNNHFAASAGGGANASIEQIKAILGQLPSFGGKDEKLQQAENMQSNAYHFDPNKYSTQETQAQIWQVLCWRDDIMRNVEAVIAKIPGLEKLVEELTQALTVYVYSILQPYIMPSLKELSTVLTKQSKSVVDEDKAQFEVFEDAYASDPTHSMLSKDHFDNILNEPCGIVAQAVVEHTVNLVVAAWSDPNVDIGWTLNEIMQAFHHPFFANPQSRVQCSMEQALYTWFQSMDPHDQDETLRRLEKDSVKHGRNKRLGSPDDQPLKHSHEPIPFNFEARSQPSGHGYDTGYSHGSSYGQATQKYDNDYLPAPSTYGQQYDDGGDNQSYSGGYQQQQSLYGYQQQPQYGYQPQSGYGYQQSYQPPPEHHQHHSGGGGGGYAGAALGGLAGLAAGVVLAEEGGDIIEGIEDAAGGFENYAEEAEDYVEGGFQDVVEDVTEDFEDY